VYLFLRVTYGVFVVKMCGWVWRIAWLTWTECGFSRMGAF
jgi:hypothetical protein